MEPSGWPTSPSIPKRSRGTKSTPANIRTAPGAHQFSWDAREAESGTHTLKTIAYDAAGNTGNSAPVTETVASTAADATPPSLTMSPSNGAIVPRSSSLTITATASDNVGVAKVEF